MCIYAAVSSDDLGEVFYFERNGCSNALGGKLGDKET